MLFISLYISAIVVVSSSEADLDIVVVFVRISPEGDITGVTTVDDASSTTVDRGLDGSEFVSSTTVANISSTSNVVDTFSDPDSVNGIILVRCYRALDYIRSM